MPISNITADHAEVAELVDAHASGACILKFAQYIAYVDAISRCAALFASKSQFHRIKRAHF